MKRRFIIASTILALLSTALCGCTEKEPVTPLLEASEPTSSVTSSDNKSAPESTNESTTESSSESLPESSVESSSEITSESEPQDDSKKSTGYTVTITNFKNGKPVDGSVETYDDHGNIIKSVSEYGNYYYSYEYNDDGTIRVMRDDDGREEYEYENGLVTSVTSYAYGRVAYVTTHTYDDYGNEVERTFESLGSVDRYTYDFTYNENGFWTKELIYKNGELTGTYTCVPGENGEHLSGRLEEENSVFTYEYKYDEQGREVELHTAYELGGMVVGESRIVTEYDEQGRTFCITEYNLGGGEQISSIKEYKYTA